MSDEKSVAQLLAESREHHKEKNRLANRRLSGTFAPDYRQAEAEIAQALDKRLAAHRLDPQHTDPSWGLDKCSHEELVTFFQVYADIQ